MNQTRSSAPLRTARKSRSIFPSGLRLMEERERRLAALDTAISRGITDIKGGRLHDADSVFDELEAKQMATERRGP